MRPDDLFDRAAAGLQRRLPAVTPADLDAPTPCAGWNVRDLLAHLAEESCWAAGVLVGDAPEVVTARCDGDLIADQPVAALDRLTAAARTVARDPSRDTVSFGERTMATGDYLTELFADYLV
ncbi:MAG: maleylpyruvate isomerase family mycothiol-dependent enzyme, partial [Actinobacteria bacterium]|nr:maleylpyruvate isomerase family mycothiol-dependent enzyme [Actinomycetota bacterium]